jgi:hypothetical protein
MWPSPGKTGVTAMEDRKTRVEMPAPSALDLRLAAVNILNRYGGLAGTCGPRLIGVFRGLIQDESLAQMAEFLRVLS